MDLLISILRAKLIYLLIIAIMFGVADLYSAVQTPVLYDLTPPATSENENPKVTDENKIEDNQDAKPTSEIDCGPALCLLNAQDMLWVDEDLKIFRFDIEPSYIINVLFIENGVSTLIHFDKSKFQDREISMCDGGERILPTT